MTTPFKIFGDSFKDARGTVSFVNDFDLKPIRRFYTIANADTNLVRGWQGHRIEHKWFHCVQGAFYIGIVQPDDWTSPATDLPVSCYELSAEHPMVLGIPPGCATAIRALEDKSLLVVYSDCTLEAAQSDNFRFDISYWNFPELL